MTIIIFLRTANYNYKQENLTLYDSLDAVGLQTIQPNISRLSKEAIQKVKNITNTYHPDEVYCSEFSRSHQTASLFSEEYKAYRQLNEIQFSMKDFSKKEELTEGSSLNSEEISIIRKNFADALLTDKLTEKKIDIQERIQDFIKGIPRNKTVLCCSHGFIMKLFENVFMYPFPTYSFDDVINAYDWRKPPYGFLQGFIVEIKGGKRTVRYI